MEPYDGGCNPADKTVLVYRLTSRECQDDSSKFAFDPDRGITSDFMWRIIEVVTLFIISLTVFFTSVSIAIQLLKIP